MDDMLLERLDTDIRALHRLYQHAITRRDKEIPYIVLISEMIEKHLQHGASLNLISDMFVNVFHIKEVEELLTIAEEWPKSARQKQVLGMLETSYLLLESDNETTSLH